MLSGGAARGAYEAGVMRFVFGDLARRIGRATWPDVVSGTSVGALNGVFAAARDGVGLGTLTGVWQHMKVEDIYRFEPGRALRQLLRPTRGESFALLDPAPFHALVERRFPGMALRRAIDNGLTRAFIVAATEVSTGFNSLYVDGRAEIPAQPGSRIYRTRMSGEHCRASAAIPFVFPAVPIDGRHHVDGGLRQNTPLRPVIAAGVTRALVIGVKQEREKEAKSRSLGGPSAAKSNERPSLLFLAGKMLNALLLDPIERDLWSAEYRNDLLSWGVSRYGADFEAAASERGLRRIEITYVQPSADLGRMAGEIYRARPPKASKSVRFLLDRVHAYTHDIEADFLSYLYFDSAYTGALEALGYEDARRHEEQIVQLLESPN
ncbi:MAG: patatin-like phospholipase family protein [Deltaproteobacteria bacterium]|nr:patatin-like phospholipase family protein [Deltaproteobacteria bacterium]